MLFTSGIHIQLSKDYGGQAFPIFEQPEIKIGSDRVTCHIHLAQEFGVEPEHVRLNRLTENDVTISPTSTSAAVFLWRGNGRRHEQIYATTALGSGDAFSVVSPQGPKFVFSLKAFPPEVQKAREENYVKRKSGTGRGRLNKESVLTEGKRQIWTRLLVLGPLQMIQRAFVFVQTGAIWQPRNIFLGLAILSGWVFSLSSCYRLNGSKKAHTQTIQKYEDCESDKEILEGMNRSEDVDFDEMVYDITRSTEIQSALKEDKDLRKQVLKRASLLARSDDYDWLLKGKGSGFVRLERWQKNIQNTDEASLDLGTAHVLSWMGASKEPSEFESFYNSDDEQVCGKGPLRLSFRQSHNLGVPAQPDAFYEGALAEMDSPQAREELIRLTLMNAGVVEEYEEGEAVPTYEYGENSPKNRQYCIYRDVEDVRDRDTALLNALFRQIGPSSGELPDAELSSGVTARIGKLFAADVKGTEFAGAEPSFTFEDQILSVQIEELGGSGSGRWILAQTAEAFARSLVLPCMLVTEREAAKDARKNLFGDENGGPSKQTCVWLHYMLTNLESDG